MLGGMSGGGMGFIFDPTRKPEAQKRLSDLMREVSEKLAGGVAFAMKPVVYDFSINERGTFAELKTGERAILARRLLQHRAAGSAPQRSAAALTASERMRPGAIQPSLPRRAAALANARAACSIGCCRTAMAATSTAETLDSLLDAEWLRSHPA